MDSGESLEVWEIERSFPSGLSPGDNAEFGQRNIHGYITDKTSSYDLGKAYLAPKLVGNYELKRFLSPSNFLLYFA